MTGKEPFFAQDTYLKPVLDNDPLLGKIDSRRLAITDHFLVESGTDAWSDEDEPLRADPQSRIALLEKNLSLANQKIADYRENLMRRIGLTDGSDDASNPVPVRDDDTHYFRSYADNGEGYSLAEIWSSY